MSFLGDIVADLTWHRLRRQPVQYSVVIRHDEEGMSFVVSDVQDSREDRLAVARDLERASKQLKLRNSHEPEQD